MSPCPSIARACNCNFFDEKDVYTCLHYMSRPTRYNSQPTVIAKLQNQHVMRI